MNDNNITIEDKQAEYLSLKEYCLRFSVGYEAVRKQLSRNKDKLEGHVIDRGSFKYLDPYAVAFLQEHMQAPLKVYDGIPRDEAEAMQEQIRTKDAEIEALKRQLALAKDALIQAQAEQVQALKNNAALEQAQRLAIEDKQATEQARQKLEFENRLLTDKNEQAERAKEELKQEKIDLMTEQTKLKLNNEILEQEKTLLTQQQKELSDELGAYKKTIFGLYKKKKG